MKNFIAHLKRVTVFIRIKVVCAANVRFIKIIIFRIMTIACIQAELYNKKRPQNELYNEDLTVKKRSFF